MRSNNRMQATAGGLGGGISCDGRAPAAPDAERSADMVMLKQALESNTAPGAVRVWRFEKHRRGMAEPYLRSHSIACCGGPR